MKTLITEATLFSENSVNGFS